MEVVTLKMSWSKAARKFPCLLFLLRFGGWIITKIWLCHATCMEVQHWGPCNSITSFFFVSWWCRGRPGFQRCSRSSCNHWQSWNLSLQGHFLKQHWLFMTCGALNPMFQIWVQLFLGHPKSFKKWPSKTPNVSLVFEPRRWQWMTLLLLVPAPSPTQCLDFEF